MENALDAKIVLTEKIPEFLNAQRTYEIFVKATAVSLNKYHELDKESIKRDDGLIGFLRKVLSAEVIAAK